LINIYFTDEELKSKLADLDPQIEENSGQVTGTEATFDIDPELKDKIEIIDIEEKLFKAKMMIIYDPSRISLAIDDYSDDKGSYVEELVVKNDAIAGINAGGFNDANYQGSGGVPDGIVIKDGQLVYGDLDDYLSIVGFNSNHKLMVGDMTAGQAIEWGMVDAVSFGPPLIVNYSYLDLSSKSDSLNPRTVIGQRGDGAVLLLVIDGRQINSVGASYQQAQDLMGRYGAENAANLDGGSSSVMVYNNEIINSVVNLSGDRAVPNAWIVKWW